MTHAHPALPDAAPARAPRAVLAPAFLTHRVEVRQILFVLALIFCASPYASPPLALAVGLLVAMFVGHPWLHLNHRATKWLLQASVVGLGFGMNLAQMVATGREGVLLTAVTITVVMVTGISLGRLLGVDGITSQLIAAGTAICGGSAIAAVGPVLKADERQLSVALGTVFVLNSVALFLFPPVGHLLGMSAGQFGLWAAIAIHDTSSVVGAALRYGPGAVGVATAVKLARALWIVPVTAALAMAKGHRRHKLPLPFFIVLFVLAAVARSYVPLPPSWYAGLAGAAGTGLTVTLFLIGSGLSWDRIRGVGVRPFVQGIALWAVVALAGLWTAWHLRLAH